VCPREEKEENDEEKEAEINEHRTKSGYLETKNQNAKSKVFKK
jgi:hypothetical protein